LSERRPQLRFQQLNLANQIVANKSIEERDVLRAGLRQATSDFEELGSILLNGSRAEGTRAPEDPDLLAALQALVAYWKSDVRPQLEILMSSNSEIEMKKTMKTLNRNSDAMYERLKKVQARATQVVDEQSRHFVILQAIFLGSAAIAVFYILWLGLTLAIRIQKLTGTASAIARGNLEARASIEGKDELAVLGANINTMTASIHAMITTEKDAREAMEKILVAGNEAANQLAASAAEILAATTQQTAVATEQISSVAEAVTTVDEVSQTADQATQRATAVAESSQRAAEVVRTGRKAVEDTVAATGMVREKSESVSTSILALAERTHAIGEIASALSDMADQTNLLALNASIEAARAGEQGKGFAVVASEVKALADQSKKATVQVRQILGEVQKATNSAVMAAEEGTRVVRGAMKDAEQAGATIRSLSETISTAATTSSQIAASAAQQVAGMGQIHQAMRNIGQATTQNLASTRQAERAAQDLNALGTRLKDLLAGYGR